MARRSRISVRRMFVLVGAAVLAPAAVLVSLQVSAGAQNVRTVTTAGTTILDHFTCYTATALPATAAPGFQVPPAVQLINQFAPNGFMAALGPVVSHCNPVAKTVNGGVTPITNPSAHLLCFAIKALTGQPPLPTVSMTNQFGTATMITLRPTTLCLPSWKSLNGPPNQTQVQPPGLDHFTCYTASYPPAGGPTFKLPPTVGLKDQFMPKPVTAVMQAPNALCLPTLKTYSPLVGPTPLVNPAAHLVCFPITVKPAVRPFKVYDQNQFGTGQVQTKKATELCVPSTKQILGNAGQVVVTKTDTAGIPLIGATFTGYAAADTLKTTPLGSCTTGATGTCTISGLPAPGSYIISETTAPAGYLGSSDQNVTITTSPGVAAVTFSDCKSAVGANCSPT